MTGPSHPQGVAGMTSAAATLLQAVASSDISDAGTQRLATTVPAASAHHALGALHRTPVPQRERREAPGDFDTTATPTAAPQHIRYVISPLVLAFITLPTRFSTVHVAAAITISRPSRTHFKMKVCERPSGSSLGGIKSLEWRPLARQFFQSYSTSALSNAAEERRVDALLRVKQQDL